LISVVLPEPVAPTMPMRSPGRTSNEMSFRTQLGVELSTTEDTVDTGERPGLAFLSSVSTVVARF
jgi:hypothetical protein